MTSNSHRHLVAHLTWHSHNLAAACRGISKVTGIPPELILQCVSIDARRILLLWPRLNETPQSGAPKDGGENAPNQPPTEEP